MYLKWEENSKVINPFGEYVWLKPCYNEKGERTGITDCCHVDDPCEYHKKQNHTE
jgi:hypothetical protein